MYDTYVVNLYVCHICVHTYVKVMVILVKEEAQISIRHSGENQLRLHFKYITTYVHAKLLTLEV